jgi:hypothetical protein
MTSCQLNMKTVTPTSETSGFPKWTSAEVELLFTGLRKRKGNIGQVSQKEFLGKRMYNDIISFYWQVWYPFLDIRSENDEKYLQLMRIFEKSEKITQRMQSTTSSSSIKMHRSHTLADNNSSRSEETLQKKMNKKKRKMEDEDA